MRAGSAKSSKAVREQLVLLGAEPRHRVALGVADVPADVEEGEVPAFVSADRQLEGGRLPLGLLVWFTVRRVSPHHGTALLAALLFAVHPLHTEAVANIAGRAELLAALGVLAAWSFHRRAASAVSSASRTRRLLAAAVERAFRDGDLVPFELGGEAGTADITRRVVEWVRSDEVRGAATEES